MADGDAFGIVGEEGFEEGELWKGWKGCEGTVMAGGSRDADPERSGRPTQL